MTPLRTSEQATLASCEKKWHYRYLQKLDDEGSPAMTKGTLWHAFWDEWWVTPGGAEYVDWGDVLGRVPDDRHNLITEQIAADVTWMAKRYDAWRPGGFEATDWRVVEQEKELEADLGGVLFQGRVDDIRLHVPTGKLYVGECKTMRDWRRLDILEVDPQLTNYVALARANDLNVVGVFYDAAKTYRWTRDENKHPPSDSFRELTYLRDAPQIKAAIKEIRAADDRRDDLIRGSRIPIRNISAQTCSFCAFRAECYEDLAFPEEDVNWSDS